jgi:hypothetical protein
VISLANEIGFFYSHARNLQCIGRLFAREQCIYIFAFFPGIMKIMCSDHSGRY